MNRTVELDNKKTGALIYRRASGFWSIDQFDEEGRFIGSSGGNYAPPSITGWAHIQWPDEPMRLAKLDLTPFIPKTRDPRVGLMRFAR